MEPEYVTSSKPFSLPLAGEESFDFSSTWQRLAGVSGLHHLPPTPHPAPSPHGLTALLEIHDGDRVTTVANDEQWQVKYRHLRENLDWLVGERPPVAQSVTAKTVFETACAGYVRRKIRLQIERKVSSQILFQAALDGHTRRRILLTVESEGVPAYLCLPTVTRTPRPAVICLHQFNQAAGARESVGLDPEHNDVAFADELARCGYVTLAFDLPGYGERRPADKSTAEAIVAFYRAEPRCSLLGRMAWEVSCAVEYLSSLDMVDSRRIGCMGHLLGGIVAMFASALDKRLKAVVASSACATFRSQIEQGVGRSIWCSGTGLLPILGFFEGEQAGLLPIEYHEIMALIAPRPMFLCTPLKSEHFPRERLEEVASHVENLYSFLGHPERLSIQYPHYFIFFPEELREDIYQWLTRFL
jgi:pimeloyl-ACP methyl ester carboxylesterase